MAEKISRNVDRCIDTPADTDFPCDVFRRAEGSLSPDDLYLVLRSIVPYLSVSSVLALRGTSKRLYREITYDDSVWLSLSGCATVDALDEKITNMESIMKACAIRSRDIEAEIGLSYWEEYTDSDFPSFPHPKKSLGTFIWFLALRCIETVGFTMIVPDIKVLKAWCSACHKICVSGNTPKQLKRAAALACQLVDKSSRVLQSQAIASERRIAGDSSRKRCIEIERNGATASTPPCKKQKYGPHRRHRS